MGNALTLELVRQAMRLLGVWLMTIGVPKSLAIMTTSEDAIVAVTGLIMYAIADGSWLVTKWKQFRERGLTRE